MTTIDDLVPEQLWQATKPLLSAALLASRFRDALAWRTRIQAAGSYARWALNQLLLRYSGWLLVLLVDGFGGPSIWPGQQATGPHRTCRPAPP